MNRISLASKRGASLTEFLILSPILVFLGMIAVDINRRIEESQRVTIASRNAIQFNDNYQEENLNSWVSRQLKEQSQVLDPNQERFVRDSEEATQLDTIADNFSTTFGMIARLQDDQSIGDTIPRGRLDQPNFQMLDSDGTASSLNNIASLTGTVTGTSSDIINTMMDGGAAIGLLIPDRLRISTVGMKTAGQNNAIQRGISILAEVVERDPQAKLDLLGIQRQFSHRSYFRVEDGFHPSAFNNSGLYAMGLTFVLDVGKWGYNGNYSQQSAYLQSRCMTRFMSDSRCNNTSTFVPPSGPRFGSFPVKVQALGWAKIAFSAATTAGSVVPVIGTGAKMADIALTTGTSILLSQLRPKIENAVKTHLVDRLSSQMRTIAEEKQGQFLDTGTEVINDMSVNFPTEDLRGALGD